MITHRHFGRPGTLAPDEGDTELSPRLIALIWLAAIFGCWALVIAVSLGVRALVG